MGIFLLTASNLGAQTYRPTLNPPPQPSSSTPSSDPNQPVENPNPDLPGPDEVLIDADKQEQDGAWIRLLGSALLQDSEMTFRAENVAWNQETGQVEAQGNVEFRNRVTGEVLRCSLARYNVNEGTGTFYDVTGTAPPRIETRPGLLTTDNPYIFTGEIAEKFGNRYTVHNGTLTDCKPENVWWRLKGQSFDVIPGQRAIARNAWFTLKGIPIFYTPFFYKSLEKQPRRSGFLTPNIGNSSIRGQTVGVGYYWAINRSHDLTYRAQYFTQRGFAHQADARGVVREGTFYNLSLFGIGAGGEGNQSQTEAGYVLNGEAQSRLANGWFVQGELRQLSSFAFRQQYTQSFDEAINSETHSTALLTNHWNGYGFNLVGQRNVNYQTDLEGDEVVLRKLPEAQFIARERQIGSLPLYAGLDSSYGLERRSQPAQLVGGAQPGYRTRNFVQRADFAPYVMTAFHKWGFDVAPSFALRQAFYDSSYINGQAVGQNLVRSVQDMMVDVSLPALSRVFAAPKWLRAGDEVKHVIEPRLTYRYVRGLNNFDEVLRFDEFDLVSNTHEVEFSLNNRILTRDGRGGSSDLLSWQLWYKRYFDPTFGGAVTANKRNVVESSLDLTGYAFLSGPRNQSPIVSVFRMQSRIGVQWRADWDPVRRSFVNSSVSLDGKFGQFFTSVGHHLLRTDPVLAPNSNQMRAQLNYGGENRRGWNYGYSLFYDYKAGTLQYTQAQVTYNTDCCGFSVQHRQFNFNVRPENQFRVAFAISNIGSFGTLRRQERMF